MPHWRMPMGHNWFQPYSENFCAKAMCFFAALLCVTQEKTQPHRCKKTAVRGMFSYEDAAKVNEFFFGIPARFGYGRNCRRTTVLGADMEVTVLESYQCPAEAFRH